MMTNQNLKKVLLFNLWSKHPYYCLKILFIFVSLPGVIKQLFVLTIKNSHIIIT